VAANATILANVHADPDPDGVYRRVRLFQVFDGKPVPSLGLASLLAASPEEKVEIAGGTIQVSGKSIPIDSNGYAILRYRGPSGTYMTFSAASVIQSELRIEAGQEPPIKDLGVFKDCYVLFGLSAPGLFDLRPTPISGVYSGVEIYATMLDNLLSGDFIRKAPWAAVVLLTLVVAGLGGLLASVSRGAVESLLSFLIALPMPVLLGIAAYKRGFWLPLTVQEMATAFALIGAVMTNYATEGKQKRFIKNAFKQYLSPAVIDQLIQHPERLKLGGERRELSIFFSDIQGFTGLSENLEPEALTALLNDYLTAMTDIIQEEGGTVDKYEGDAIIAFWGAPLELPDHGERAVRAALRCQAKLAELRPGFRTRAGKDIFTRIGLHTGAVVVGNMGSHKRFDYTILGDAANLASRLEGINKQFGTHTMISEATRSQIGDSLAAREVSLVAVVGRKEPVRVFEPMFVEEFENRRAALDIFAQALEAYYRGDFPKALDSFRAIEKDDPVAAAYVSRCTALSAHRPLEWKGVWTMTEK
jgi:adenylate cyclase